MAIDYCTYKKFKAIKIELIRLYAFGSLEEPFN